MRSPRPCYGIASFLITTEEFTSLVLITDDDVAVTWLRIMLKLLSRSRIIRVEETMTKKLEPFNFVERTRNIDIFFYIYIYDFSVCVIYNKKKKVE